MAVGGHEWIIVLIVVAVVALLGVNFWLAAKRRKELAAWAQSRGLRFSPDKDRSMDQVFPEFACLREGSNRYAYNIAQGALDGQRLTAFDYHYETYSRDSKGRRQTNHHTFSATILGSAVPLKPLLIRPEGVFDKLAEFFGLDDIDFESAEFSRAFFVKAEDRRWAYDVLHPRAMQFLLDSPRFALQFGRGEVIAHRGSTFRVEEFEAAVQLAQGLLGRFPDYLVKQLREE